MIAAYLLRKRFILNHVNETQTGIFDSFCSRGCMLSLFHQFPMRFLFLNQQNKIEKLGRHS